MWKRKLGILLGALALCPLIFSTQGWTAEKEITIEEFLQQLSSVPFVLNRRDPFTKVMAPFNAELGGAGGASVAASVLERYPLRDYTLVATLIGDVYSRALVKVPESGKILIVRERDKIGNRGGVIKRVAKDQLVVEEQKKNEAGFVDRAEVLLTLQTSQTPLETLKPEEPVKSGASMKPPARN